MIEKLLSIFANPIIVIFFIAMLLMIVVMWVLEHREYKKTYAKLPRFLWPSKGWWKENKVYARTVMLNHEDKK